MRIWFPIPFCCIDTKHLKASHGELHGIYNIITLGHKGYSHHPEVVRWCNHLPALVEYHNDLIVELEERGMNHYSPLDNNYLDNEIVYPDTIEPLEEMIIKLRNKMIMMQGQEEYIEALDQFAMVSL